MDILAITALIALVVLGVMVLRLKSDPMENETIRKSLADSKPTTSAVPLDAAQHSESDTKQ
jgi:hypothetical protein